MAKLIACKKRRFVSLLLPATSDSFWYLILIYDEKLILMTIATGASM